MQQNLLGHAGKTKEEELTAIEAQTAEKMAYADAIRRDRDDRLQRLNGTLPQEGLLPQQSRGAGEYISAFLHPNSETLSDEAKMQGIIEYSNQGLAVCDKIIEELEEEELLAPTTLEWAQVVRADVTDLVHQINDLDSATKAMQSLLELRAILKENIEELSSELLKSEGITARGAMRSSEDITKAHTVTAKYLQAVAGTRRTAWEPGRFDKNIKKMEAAIREMQLQGEASKEEAYALYDRVDQCLERTDIYEKAQKLSALRDEMILMANKSKSAAIIEARKQRYIDERSVAVRGAQGCTNSFATACSKLERNLVIFSLLSEASQWGIDAREYAAMTPAKKGSKGNSELKKIFHKIRKKGAEATGQSFAQVTLEKSGITDQESFDRYLARLERGILREAPSIVGPDDPTLVKLQREGAASCTIAELQDLASSAGTKARMAEEFTFEGVGSALSWALEGQGVGPELKATLDKIPDTARAWYLDNLYSILSDETTSIDQQQKIERLKMGLSTANLQKNVVGTSIGVGLLASGGSLPPVGAAVMAGLAIVVGLSSIASNQIERLPHNVFAEQSRERDISQKVVSLRMAASNSGPELEEAIAELLAVNGISRRNQEQMLQDFFAAVDAIPEEDFDKAVKEATAALQPTGQFSLKVRF